MAIYARPIDEQDAESLSAIDDAYALSHGLERRVTTASLRFFARTGHSFVAVDGGEVRGFVLAQPLFDGERPTVVSARLASTPPGDETALLALIRALTKSAYDAGVYDLQVVVPSGDLAGAAALAMETYVSEAVVSFARKLGSRGRGVEPEVSDDD